MMSHLRTERIKPAVTKDEIRPDLIRIGRRAALKGGLSLASLALLTGCAALSACSARCSAAASIRGPLPTGAG